MCDKTRNATEDYRQYPGSRSDVLQKEYADKPQEPGPKIQREFEGGPVYPGDSELKQNVRQVPPEMNYGSMDSLAQAKVPTGPFQFLGLPPYEANLSYLYLIRPIFHDQINGRIHLMVDLISHSSRYGLSACFSRTEWFTEATAKALEDHLRRTYLRDY